MSKFASLWYWREHLLDNQWWRVESFDTEEHPKSSTIYGTERPSSAAPFSWTSLDETGHLVVGIDPRDHLPTTPALWWALVEDDNAIVPNVSLIAFADDRYSDGTVLTAAQLRAEIGTPPAQAGAIRWAKGEAKIEQIYTAPEFRRRRMSIKMVNAADILNEASGWGGYLYGGEELTPDGQQLASAWTSSRRLRQQSVHVLPAE